MDRPISRPSSNPINENKRKILMRSTGSFSTIEDNIVAPAPRRFSNLVSSPKVSRRQKSPEEGLFGEAGFEIQSILFQQAAMSRPPLPITVLLEDAHKESPLRASNPITLNSPFHLEEEQRRPSKKPAHDLIPASSRLYPAVGRRGTSVLSRKDLNRGRSLSWPGVPKGKIDVIPRTEVVAH